MRRNSGGIVLLALLLVGAWAANHFGPDSEMRATLDEDERNSGIDMAAHYQWYVNPNVLVVALTDATGKAPIDVFRAFLNFAERMQGSKCDTVVLAYGSETRFVIDGSYFHTLGAEYGEQNPLYTMRTFAENLRDEDGNRPYPTWEGGVLGVTAKQMEEFAAAISLWAAP